MSRTQTGGEQRTRMGTFRAQRRGSEWGVLDRAPGRDHSDSKEQEDYKTGGAGHSFAITDPA